MISNMCIPISGQCLPTLSSRFFNHFISNSCPSLFNFKITQLHKITPRTGYVPVLRYEVGALHNCYFSPSWNKMNVFEIVICSALLLYMAIRYWNVFIYSKGKCRVDSRPLESNFFPFPNAFAHTIDDSSRSKVLQEVKTVLIFLSKKIPCMMVCGTKDFLTYFLLILLNLLCLLSPFSMQLRLSIHLPMAHYVDLCPSPFPQKRIKATKMIWDKTIDPWLLWSSILQFMHRPQSDEWKNYMHLNLHVTCSGVLVKLSRLTFSREVIELMDNTRHICVLINVQCNWFSY